MIHDSTSSMKLKKVDTGIGVEYFKYHKKWKWTLIEAEEYYSLMEKKYDYPNRKNISISPDGFNFEEYY